jgi:hypothetical protein
MTKITYDNTDRITKGTMLYYNYDGYNMTMRSSALFMVSKVNTDITMRKLWGCDKTDWPNVIVRSRGDLRRLAYFLLAE